MAINVKFYEYDYEYDYQYCFGLCLPTNCNFLVDGYRVSFCLHARSPCEAGGSSSSGPFFHSRNLSHPHTPLSGDSDWNMDYLKELLAVRGKYFTLHLLYD